ncbi:hypothetical protein ACFWCF_26045 [Rhodococcus sp. NPDC060090]|uniref:hypothetical protein n=1 Tax=Rhodococcus sp. NPDC060090 TaxID=3347056 RepID=UPI00365461EE
MQRAGSTSRAPSRRPLIDLYVVDGVVYTDSPALFPAAAWFLLGALTAAAVLSWALLHARWRLEHTHRRAWPLPVVLATVGGLFGGATSLIGTLVEPRPRWVVETEPRNPADPYPPLDAAHLDLTPTIVIFPVLDAGIGLVVAAALLLAGLRLDRTDSSTEEAS